MRARLRIAQVMGLVNDRQAEGRRRIERQQSRTAILAGRANEVVLAAQQLQVHDCPREALRPDAVEVCLSRQ